jgi:hypothetical protein
MADLGSTSRPSAAAPPRSLLLPGMWVEVRSPDEILSTLDADQSLEGLPFMPEMLPFCGRRYRVALRAERTCVHPPAMPLRRLEGAVVLEGLRCDGALHGGCQLGCMLFWKEAWLRRVPDANTSDAASEPEETPALRVTRSSDPERYFCQATELPRATYPGDPLWKPGQYLRLLKVRTFTLSELFSMFVRMGRRRAARLLRPVTQHRVTARARNDATLALRPGEWVEVKSRAEILPTLDERRTFMGSSFGGDMYEECGRRLRVHKRVDRIIEEGTGTLRPVQDTVILEGSLCDRYFGCARVIPFQWQEVWLKRVESGLSAPELPAESLRGVRRDRPK